MTATGEGVSYASLLKRAQEEVDLADIGIQDASSGRFDLHIKRARNGGYLLEVSGTDSADKADRLARELEEVLQGEAKVARPVKLAEMRVTGLGDDVTPEQVATALQKAGECSRVDLVLGEVRRAPGGLGAIWVRCPLAAARKVVAARGLRMGWTCAGVQLLEERPLQCYRCLKFGHLAAACKDPSDHKGRCFRCGGAGHVARGCGVDPHCIPCDKAGWPSGHRMGGRACQAAAAAWRKKGGCPAPLRTPVIAPGRGRGRGLPPPDIAKRAGAEGDFVVPRSPAPRAKRGGKARAPPPPTTPALPEEGEGAGLVVEILSGSQTLPETQCSGRSVVDEEEAAEISSLFLQEEDMDVWRDEESQAGTQ